MISVTVIVSGRAVKLEAHPSMTIRSLAKQALQKSGDVGQQFEGWEMRNTDGQLYEYGVRLYDYPLRSGQTLFLSPRAGVGASACA